MFLSLINHAISRLLRNRPICYFFKAITGRLGSEKRQKPTGGSWDRRALSKSLAPSPPPYPTHVFLCQLIKGLALKDECAFSDFWVSSSHLVIWFYLFIFCPCHCGVVAWMHMLPPTHEMRLCHQHTHRGRMLSFILSLRLSFLPYYSPNVEPKDFNMSKIVISTVYIYPFSSYSSLFDRFRPSDQSSCSYVAVILQWFMYLNMQPEDIVIINQPRVSETSIHASSWQVQCSEKCMDSCV